MLSTVDEVASELVGRPFRRDARGPDAYDCVGIVLELARRVLGRELPDPAGDDGLLEDRIARFRDSFRPAKKPYRALDVIHIPRSDALYDQHIAVLLEGGYVLDALEGVGVFRRVSEPYLRLGAKVYRLCPSN